MTLVSVKIKEHGSVANMAHLVYVKPDCFDMDCGESSCEMEDVPEWHDASFPGQMHICFYCHKCEETEYDFVEFHAVDRNWELHGD